MIEMSPVLDDVDVPIYVDLDGTLIRSDMLYESLLALLKQNIFYVFILPLWLLRGRANLKEQISLRASPRIELLPYNQELIKYLEEKKHQGSRLILATASNRRLADRVNSHLRLFDDVLASDADKNLKGSKKLEVILQRQRGHEFDYAGDSPADRKIFAQARRLVLVGSNRGMEQYVAGIGKSYKVIRLKSLGIGGFLKSIRLYQWVKNILVLVPLVTSHSWFDEQRIIAAVTGFVAFGLCASSIYLLNDLFDLDSDRDHSVKKYRALASGEMSISHGFLWSALMLAIGLILAYRVEPQFFFILVLYVLATAAYTLSLKKIVLVDVIVLAGLYTTRVIAGAALIHVELSFWLLAFSTFFFLSLSLVKRCGELLMLKQSERRSARGRDYRVDDFSVLREMGMVSGYLTILIVALYINDPSVKELYQNERLLWLLCPLLLYWISRMWLKTNRGEMHSDPIVYAMKDKVSILVAVMMFIVVLTAK